MPMDKNEIARWRASINLDVETKRILDIINSTMWAQSNYSLRTKVSASWAKLHIVFTNQEIAHALFQELMKEARTHGNTAEETNTQINNVRNYLRSTREYLSSFDAAVQEHSIDSKCSTSHYVGTDYQPVDLKVQIAGIIESFRVHVHIERDFIDWHRLSARWFIKLKQDFSDEMIANALIDNLVNGDDFVYIAGLLVQTFDFAPKLENLKTVFQELVEKHADTYIHSLLRSLHDRTTRLERLSMY